LTLITAGCGGDGGEKGETGFKIKPGSLTELTINNKSYSIDGLSLSQGLSPSTHAIIFSGTVNNQNYVGIAVNNDITVANSSCLYIYFNSSDIPSSITLDSTDPNHILKYRKSPSTTFTPWTNNGATITLSFLNNGDGTYTIQDTAITGTVNFGGDILTSVDIIAQKYP
ncbi:MAG TPA: hypothetical protein VLM75_10685, partial [Spirochaetota bacterium]|nr:hypothetical protein [Spirochaetota bacterium]